MTRRAAFVDRDGTLNRERSFVKHVDELEILPHALDSVRRLTEAGFEVVVITNQSGIARGLYDEMTLDRIHGAMHDALQRLPRGYFHCPHHPDESGPYGRDCHCRKPKTGLIEQAAEVLGLDLARSYVIGDSARDVIAGRSLPLRSVLVRSGKPWREQLDRLERDGYAPDFVADDIRAATEWILTDRPAP